MKSLLDGINATATDATAIPRATRAQELSWALADNPLKRLALWPHLRGGRRTRLMLQPAVVQLTTAAGPLGDVFRRRIRRRPRWPS